MVPAPPEDTVEAARLAPDHRISVAGPGRHGEGVPPDWAAVGRRRTGPAGESEEWEDDERHRPPEALGWPAPTDDVDRALQRTVTGHGPAGYVRPVVPVSTFPPHLDAVGGFVLERLTATDLLDRLPAGHTLYAGPPSPAGTVPEPGPLAGTARAHTAGRCDPGRGTRTAVRVVLSGDT
ncbi:hypothetical protein [Streptomyces daghestanicus]|uniref:Uncharacterized protein n=1 Tax=Streptomyces daghestanicus TaxID=66885 RepID=A0ABQ3Q8G9_9ACTN|nr:hypothetical protein [Streptomyces daghestanicus]GGU46254.1 hypothetical protein GCM10010259_41320 [Streptomyces daghestanicus]GHI33565.1 hypothetical protein Sdagh_52950 [Streptomyces daghestanicus]